MRIRTIKPEFWANEALCSLSVETHLCAAALLNYADDEGYFNANPALVKAAIFPLRELSVSTQQILTDLASIGYIRLGVAVDGRRYGHVCKFTQHQRINRPTDSQIKNLDITWNDSLSTHGALSEDSLLEGKGKEGKGKEQGKERGTGAKAPRASDPFKPPTVEEVKRYCQERGNSVNAERFHNHYKMVGWKVGRNPMKDWQAAVCKWEADDKEYTNGNGKHHQSVSEKAKQLDEKAWNDGDGESVLGDSASSISE
jgi:hypothetical protein